MSDRNQLKATIYQQQRLELTGYLTRFVTRGDIAEELAQQAVVKMLEAKSASLLLKSVYGFTVKETASVMDSSIIQVKNRIQSARSKISRRYADSCALVTQRGACFQCVELDHFFNSKNRNPLENTSGVL